MKRNPYLVGLIVAGCLLLLTAFVVQSGLSNTSEYQPYDFTAVIGLTSWVALLFGGSIAAFIGAVVIAGISWSMRNPALPAESADDREDGRVG